MITKSEPDEHGHWGKFGGRYVPETLVRALEELTQEFMRARGDDNFWRELGRLLRDYCGRPTALFHAQRLTEHAVARRFSLSGKIFCTPARTKSTMQSDKRSLRGAWANAA